VGLAHHSTFGISRLIIGNPPTSRPDFSRVRRDRATHSDALRGDGTPIRVEGQANWFSVICVRGKQHEISTGTSDLKLAKRFHRQKLDELAADRQGLKQFTTPQHRQLQLGSLLDDLVSDYRVRRVKSLGSALSHIKPLREHFGDWRAVDINYRAIEAYITKRRENEKANATINRELELLRRALRLAHDRQLLPSIPKVRESRASLARTSSIALLMWDMMWKRSRMCRAWPAFLATTRR